MGDHVEHEICGNCKKEIPQHNYVMHTAHCARNITLCQVCKEPVQKNQFEQHKKSCAAVKPKVRKPEAPPANFERSHYYQGQQKVQEEKAAARKEKRLQKLERFVDVGQTCRSEPPKAAASLIACRYCELELPKLELEEHEDYCGTRTDKCLECGELVMFKNKQIHMDSNHGSFKRKDEASPRALWDSATEHTQTPPSQRRRPAPLRSFSSLDTTLYSFPATFSTPASATKEKSESYKEISRRLDCPAPQAPVKKRHPPTELTIPCEFCNVPVPHEDLIQHETGCRPDLARFTPRRRASPEPDDYFVAPQPSSPEVELPCEFCSDMIPASQLLRHQATCI